MLNFSKSFQDVLNFYVDILFPVECLGCGQDKVWLCPFCFEKIKPLDNSNCPLCGNYSFLGNICFSCRQSSYLKGILIAADYQQEVLKKAISTFKYNFIRDLGDCLADLLIRRLKEQIQIDISLLNFDLIIPVPLHKKRLLFRGFNQSEILAQKVTQEFSWPLLTDVLIRTKNTFSQMKLKPSQRKLNVKNVFQVKDKTVVGGKKILLIDDVFTTGTTLQECAKVLKRVGAQEIWALVLAKA